MRGDDDALRTEFGLGDLVLVELTDRQRLPVIPRQQMCAGVQGDDAPVHRVLRPAVGARGKILPQLAASNPAADLAMDFLADRVLFCCALVIHGPQRRVVAIAGAVDDRGPRLVIRFVEAGEQAGQRIRCALAHLFRQRQVEQFRAAALIDLRAAGNLRNELVARALRVAQPCVQTAPRLLSLGRAGHALGVNRAAGRFGPDDLLAQIFRRCLRDEHEQDRAVCARRPRRVHHILLRGVPFVAHPHRDALPRRIRRLRREVQHQVARFVARTLLQPHSVDFFLQRRLQQRVTLLMD